MIKRSQALSVLLAVIAALSVSAPAFAKQSTLNRKGNQAPSNVKVSHYKDWDVRCPKSNNKQARCEMTQLVNNPNNGKPIMRVVMGYPPQAKGAAMIFVTPLGTRLAPGLKLSVDGDKSRRFPFQICLKQGCRADYPVRATLLNKFKHGSNANVQLIGPRGKKINLRISLQGFTAANSRISQ